MEEFLSLCIENIRVFFPYFFSEIYSIVILPNLGWILFFCILIAVYVISSKIKMTVQIWLDKIR